MIKHYGFYVIRRPTNSIDFLYSFHQQIRNSSFEQSLKEYFHRDLLFQEALFLASPTVHDRFKRFLNGEDMTDGKQLQYSVYKYLVRSSMRCTPFGLFSCCATGNIGAPTVMQMSKNSIERFVQLDMRALDAISANLLDNDAIRSQLTFTPNNSLYSYKNYHYYIEDVEFEGRQQYYISAVKKAGTLSLALKRAKNGARLPDLISTLTANGIDFQNSKQYVLSLVENRILKSEIEPQTSNKKFLDHLTARTSELVNADDVSSSLRHLQAVLGQQKNIPDLNRDVKNAVQKLAPSFNDLSVIKVDSFDRVTENSLSEGVVQEIGGYIEELLKLNQNIVSKDLTDFKARFQKRYNAEEIPLLMALDDYNGIGYGVLTGRASSAHKLVEDLKIPIGNSGPDVYINNVHRWIINRYIQTIQNHQDVLNLTDDDLRDIVNQNSNPLIPPGHATNFFIFGNLISQSARQIDNGDFSFNLLSCQGPSAVKMMARFADGLPELADKIQKCLVTEENANPDIIFAEILYQPGGAAGNIVTRPKTYQYEIPIMGFSGINEDYQISLDDIMVSIQSNEVVLRSKRLDRKVIPRLSNMHNHKNSLTVYRFLCDLQGQDGNLNLFWDWGLLEKQSHLPRVIYKKIILHREMWNLSLGSLPMTLENLENSLQQNRLPPRFVVSSGDNELLIDTSLEESKKLLLGLIRKNKSVRILEFLGRPDISVLTDGEDRFVSELIIPFYKKEILPIPPLTAPSKNQVKSKFLLGSEWLFLKIYHNEQFSDSAVLKLISLAVKKMRRNNIIEQFFFIRYSDSDTHFRLRFKGDPKRKFHLDVLSVLHDYFKSFLHQDKIFDIQIDAYEREIERYGALTIDICEQLFYLDSMQTLSFLSKKDRSENERIIYALIKIDSLFFSAGLMTKHRQSVLDKMRESFFQEFGGNLDLRKQLNQYFKEYKSEIELALIGSELPLLAEQTRIFGQLKRQTPKNTDVDKILTSIIHMSVNRIFPFKQRKYELILYHCLYKFYDFAEARRTEFEKEKAPMNI